MSSQTQSISIMGYSERGVINSLFYEMHCRSDGKEVLQKFLGEIKFPYKDSKPRFDNLGRTEILIEQSLSDFGDSDAIILLEKNDGTKSVIFIEAKVSEHKNWKIGSVFDYFKQNWDDKNWKDGKYPKGYTSNLFTQLYLKFAFVKKLTELQGEKIDDLNILHENLPKVLRKKQRRATERTLGRKIGTNSVVLKAAEEISKHMQNDISNAFFVMIVPPEEQSKTENFFKETFPKDINCLFDENENPDYIKWDIENLGYITWGKIEEFCDEDKENLKNTKEVFEFNDGQIYDRKKYKEAR